MDAGGGHHTWGVRPSDFLSTVRDKNDLHNISADSGLSHSPIQRETPQLTIGKPIKHIDNLHSQPRHEEQSRGAKWNIGSLFKRKQKISDSHSDVSNVSSKVQGNVGKKVTNNSLVLPERNVSVSSGAAPPPLPPKNSNIFQPSMQVRGGHAGGHGHSQDIFPQLRADLQYPEHVATDPRWTQVRTGGYYDQQILAMAGEHHQLMRHQGALVTPGQHHGQHHDQPPCHPSGQQPVSLRRTGSVGSSCSSGNRRSRAARTERYLNRKSRDNTGDTIGPHCPRSASVEPHNHAPPPPPPRDPRLKNQLMRQHRGRPVSYSFEHLRQLSQPSRHNHQHPQLPPRSHHSGTDLSPGITQHNSAGTLPSNSIVTSTPIHSHKSELNFSGHTQAQCLQNYIDHEPRSRRPIAYTQSAQTHSHNGSNASSEGIGSQTSLDDSQYVISPTPHVTGSRHASRAIPRVIGTSSPASVSSKDSGCSASSDNAGVRNAINQDGLAKVSDEPMAGFSTKKRRSKFEEAIRELEGVCDDIAKDEDLLDRAERRDLPTAHQLLIWRDRESDTSHNTSADSALSDFDAAVNWNTSSSFEHLSCSGVSRARTPSNRRSGVSDKVGDDMMIRRISAANKAPSTLTSLSELANQSYLSVSSVLATEDPSDDDPDQPDIRTDDVLNRNIRDANLIKVIEPQPKFGVPLGPISGGANSDYLHAVPDGKYRSTFNCMRHPDLVKDDLAFRYLRKDDNLSTDPLTLGIVKDSRELVTNNTFWPQFKKEEETPRLDRDSPPLVHNLNRSNPMIRSLSENIAQIIRKQSCKPGARLDDIITYKDLNDPLVYDTMKYTMDLISRQQKLGTRKTAAGAPQSLHKSQDKLCQEKSGTTVYDLLSRIKTEAEDVNENVKDDVGDDDEGVASVSSPELTNSSLDNTVINASSYLPDLVTTPDPDNMSHQAGEIEPDLENHSGAHQLIVQSCLIEQTNLDQLNDKEKSSLLKPGASFISSFVEESKRLSLKTLSDGGSLEDDDTDNDTEQLNKIQSELQDVVDKIDESIKGCNDFIEPKENTTLQHLGKDSELTPCEKSDSLPAAEDVPTVRHKISELGVTAADMLEQWSLGSGGEAGGCKLTDPSDEDLSLPGV